MASPQQERGGYECEFVERPPELFQSECPICLLVLREPYQATCCGNSFCKTCIERIRADNKPCPTCNHAELTVFQDKRLQRSLYTFKVRCPHQREGCEWVGELSELDRHLNTTPEFGKQLEGCLFSEVECIHCGEPFQRRHVEAHQNDSCPRRPFSCDYCRDHGADYEDVVNKHWPVCPCVPVPCPNECGVYPERQNLQHHVNEECPHQVVDCDFHYAGCKVRLPRKDMPAHLIKSLVAHVSLVATHSDARIASLEKENEALKQEVTQLKCKQEELQSYTGVLPVEFAMTNFEQHKRDDDSWFSPSFYTHPYGYRMCLDVDANGYGDGKGTHVSVFASLMRGKFDDSLSWPFHGHVTIQLLNQLEDGEHHSCVVYFSETPGARVTTGDRAENALGTNTFILHTDLGHNPAKNCQYLKDDCLHFRVTRVTNVNPVPQHGAQLLAIEPHVCVVPIELIMTSFDQHKRVSDSWYSPPFYTHPQGYRMCLCVDANGFDAGKGTHVSVFYCLMHGKYDNSLKWPFRNDVTIQLLNKSEDSNHHTEIFPFNDRARVTSGEIGVGWGEYLFIPHTELNKYLKNDCLFFHVAEVTGVNVRPPLLERRILNLESSVRVPPIALTLSDFDQHKREDDIWYSPPFYTHPQGYRMCLRVEANGHGDGKGTHVSVFVCLMRGQHDDALKWPFRGKVTIQLLNQLEDSGPHTRIIPFIGQTVAGRVTHGGRGDGRGFLQFISHTDLGHNPAENCQYLKDDRLRFRMSKVELM